MAVTDSRFLPIRTVRAWDSSAHYLQFSRMEAVEMDAKNVREAGKRAELPPLKSSFQTVIEVKTVEKSAPKSLEWNERRSIRLEGVRMFASAMTSRLTG